MRALTLLYEQQKKASGILRNNNPSSSPKPNHQEKRFASHPSVDLLTSCKTQDEKEQRDPKFNNVMMENTVPTLPTMVNPTVTTTIVLPQPPLDGAKENFLIGTDNILEFSSCARKATATTTTEMAKPVVVAVARKLSMLGARNVQELEKMESNANTEKTGRIGGNESRIHVFVKLRLMAKKEKEAGSRCCVKIVNKKDVYLTEFANENDYLRLKRLKGRHFSFDASFSESTTQHEVYSSTTAELVEAVLQGQNGSVFCYGATGAGKTYTMLGTLESPGVIVLAIKDLFTNIRQRSFDGNHAVHLSYFEVYNETVRDLLSPGRPLVLREDKQGIVAAGITQYKAYSADEVMALLQRGNQNRTTEPTRANETSSRSHAILQVAVEYQVKDASMNIINRVGKISLIDLAGSERALATDQRTLRSLEGANINRSLLALSSCINALVEGKKHIPYRNSKLTQLLKDSLGGACNTVMIANISPSNLSFGETQNTLHWAYRAKEIRTKANLLLELQKENRELRVQLTCQQQKLVTLQSQSLAAYASQTPSSVTSLTTPSMAQPREKCKPRSTFLNRNCFTSESRKRGAEVEVKDLRLTLKALELEMARMKKEHAEQLKQKDAIIRELSKKNEKTSEVGVKKVGTRASLRPKEPNPGELKSPSHRFRSPVPTAKKRSFWDITGIKIPIQNCVVSLLTSHDGRSFSALSPSSRRPLFLCSLTKLTTPLEGFLKATDEVQKTAKLRAPAPPTPNLSGILCLSISFTVSGAVSLFFSLLCSIWIWEMGI
ncbi:hypothetical protein V6N13_074295 [Hibiscus sabdariffa]